MEITPEQYERIRDCFAVQRGNVRQPAIELRVGQLLSELASLERSNEENRSAATRATTLATASLRSASKYAW